jgi:hypothetical protein
VHYAQVRAGAPADGTKISRISSNREPDKSKQTKHFIVMAPLTRSTARPSTPIKSSRLSEYDTIIRAGFLTLMTRVIHAFP